MYSSVTHTGKLELRTKGVCASNYLFIAPNNLSDIIVQRNLLFPTKLRTKITKLNMFSPLIPAHRIKKYNNSI